MFNVSKVYTFLNYFQVKNHFDCRLLTGLLTGFLTELLTGILTGFLSELLTGILTGPFAEILTGILSFFLGKIQSNEYFKIQPIRKNRLQHQYRDSALLFTHFLRNDFLISFDTPMFLILHYSKFFPLYK